MKRLSLLAALAAAILLLHSPAAVQAQGQYRFNTNLLNSFSLQFRFSSNILATSVKSAVMASVSRSRGGPIVPIDPINPNDPSLEQVAGPIIVTNVDLSSGVANLLLDFGTNVFSDGQAYWLTLSVASNSTGAPFTLLSPALPITAAPSAAAAFSFVGSLASSNISGGYSNAVTFSNPGNAFYGSISGDGSGLTNLNLNPFSGPVSFLNPTNFFTGSFTGNGSGLTNLSCSACSNIFWELLGNAGTTAGLNFVGTTDNQPLEMKVFSTRALRLEPNSSAAPNVIGGAPVNSVDAGFVGATIGGGGATNYGFPFPPALTNRVSSDFGTIGGGERNWVGSNANVGTIAGGDQNSMTSAWYSTIGGGSRNTIEDYNATIAGGFSNDNAANASAIGGGSDNGIRPGAYYSTVAGGDNNYIQTNAFGATIGGGYNNSVGTNANFATIPGGTLALAHNYGQMGYSSGAFGALGDAQMSHYVLRGTSTNSVIGTVLRADGASSELLIASNATVAFTAIVVARDNAGNSAAWRFEGVIDGSGAYNAQAPVLMGSTPGALQFSQPGIESAAPGRLWLVSGTSNTSLPTRWVATVRTAEVTF